jgi:hypothetical protein
MATVRKPAQRESSGGQSSAKKAAAGKQSADGQRPPAEKPASARRRGRQSLRTVALSAARELADLIGHVPEGIVATEKTDDGWRVQVEVVESRRIPETTDIMAVYEVDLDAEAVVTGYRRLNRYVRGRFRE